ncbi:unnamed protein product [Larinioides sclopetarius]|uniref:Uncharacterized protein n=1 Tax=Larinioides sclopetarius TaxID=280406 RepID=A0AAV2ATE3_9ARAC
MEKKLDLVPKLSLNEMALRRVVVNLYYESLSDTMGKGFKLADEFGFWQKKTEDVKWKVSNLALPKLLKKKLTNSVEPICTEMQRWKLLHEAF